MEPEYLENAQKRGEERLKYLQTLMSADDVKRVALEAQKRKEVEDSHMKENIWNFYKPRIATEINGQAQMGGKMITIPQSFFEKDLDKLWGSFHSSLITREAVVTAKLKEAGYGVTISNEPGFSMIISWA